MGTVVALTDVQYQGILQAIQFGADSVVFAVEVAGFSILAALMVCHFWGRW